MHAQKVSHKILDNACAWMHTARRNALKVNVLAAIAGRRLCVTGLGRMIESPAKEKHCIKRADRLIGNPHLYDEHRDVYMSFTRLIIGAARRPVILIDWSDLDPFKRHFLLRASVAMDGRSLTIYEEVHGLDTKEKPATHKTFLNRLKQMLAPECRPIVVTDAGFRTPWFKLIDKHGWDWVGRLRNRNLVRTSEDSPWFPCKSLYDNATTKPKYLGQMQLTRRGSIQCHFVIYKAKAKGRSRITCNGERARLKHSEQCAQREREPWLLVTSLPASSKMTKRVVDIYRTRMQIEESFRDVKSVRFGVGFELNMSRSARRVQLLLLVAMVAAFTLWLLGMAARISGQNWQYQANTVKNRHVLSPMYLGLRVAYDSRFVFRMTHLAQLGKLLHDMVKRHCMGW